MKICQLTSSTEKQAVTRSILEALPEWFGIPEAREDYITESGDKQFFCAYDADKPVGFLYLKETGTATVELYVKGIPSPGDWTGTVSKRKRSSRQSRLFFYAGKNCTDGKIRGI